MFDKSVLLIFVVSLAVASVAVFLDPVRWWDEAVYCSLGWNLHNNPFDYSFKKFDDNSKDYPGQAGFRAPLLPYTVALTYSISKNFPIEFIVLLFSALGSVTLYILCKQFFDKNLSMLAALLLALMPMHAYYSGKIMTDVFATTLATFTVLLFWIGFEKGNNKAKVASGALLGLTVLARYTLIWLPVVLFLYLVLKNKSLKFIDRHFIFSAITFLIILSPWLWYGQQTYGTPFGPLIHASKAVTYWGGLQPWNFYFQYFPEMFSIGIIIAGIAGLFLLVKNICNAKENSFLLLIGLWFIFSLGFSMIMEHKEDRFVMPTTPAVAILAALGTSAIKKYSKHVAIAVMLIALLTTAVKLYDTAKVSYRQDSLCYIDAMNFLKTTEADSVVLTVNSPVVYFYSHRETAYAPQSQTGLLAKTAQFNKPVYYLSSKYDGAKTLDLKNTIKPAWSCGADATVWKLK